MYRRPAAFSNRPFCNIELSEDLVIVRVRGGRNKVGEFVQVESKEYVKGVTAPSTTDGTTGKQRGPEEGGVELKSARTFWTVEAADPAREDMKPGDFIEYQSVRYRIEKSSRWDGFSEHVCERVEPQP